ncbi:MAG: hypothetical protein K9G44_01845 [Melioribacteraceae bacterium]|nr:hypothetical protein [Melioribacteraceae bacterium]
MRKISLYQIINSFRLLSFVFAIILLQSCDDVSDEIVNAESSKFNVIEVNVPTSFIYSANNNSIAVTAKIDNNSFVEKIEAYVYNELKSNQIIDPVELKDDGSSTSGDNAKNDLTYSGIINFNSEMVSSDYIIEIVIVYTQFGEQLSDIISQTKLDYSSGVQNVTPVISNLVIPSSVTFSSAFKFSVKVEDQNGLTDIDKVWYELFRPNGTQVQNSQGITKFDLYDDGPSSASNSGDLVSNDGVYTSQLTFPSGQPTGEWRMEFFARDLSGEVSNKIEAKVNLQ